MLDHLKRPDSSHKIENSGLFTTQSYSRRFFPQLACVMSTYMVYNTECKYVTHQNGINWVYWYDNVDPTGPSFRENSWMIL